MNRPSDVRRHAVWQESCVLRSMARAGIPVTNWTPVDYWDEWENARKQSSTSFKQRTAA